MSSSTVRKYSYGCLGIIAAAFVGLVILFAALPDDELSEVAAEPEGPSLAEATREYYYERYVTEVDGEEVFESPGDFSERTEGQVPALEWQDTDEHTITVTAMEMEQEYYDALCSNIQSAGWPGLLDGETSDLMLDHIIVRDEAGEEVASCDNLFMRQD